MTTTMQTSSGRTDVRGDTNNNMLVALGSLISGEEQANGRMRIEALPVDADSVLETLQNAAVATGNRVLLYPFSEGSGGAVDVFGVQATTQAPGSGASWSTDTPFMDRVSAASRTIGTTRTMAS